MTEESTFQPLGETDRELHGTSALIVCGFAATEQDELVDLTRVLGLRTVPIIFIVRGDGSKTLRELALLPDLTGQGGEIPVPRAVIMSGLTEKQLICICAPGLPPRFCTYSNARCVTVGSMPKSRIM